jgi:hypothetical protein
MYAIPQFSHVEEDSLNYSENLPCLNSPLFWKALRRHLMKIAQKESPSPHKTNLTVSTNEGLCLTYNSANVNDFKEKL